MLFPIRCRCGQSLGDLADAFKTLRFLRVQQAVIETGRYIDPSILGTVDSLSPALGRELDDLGLHSECCRMVIMTCVEFREMLT